MIAQLLVVAFLIGSRTPEVGFEKKMIDGGAAEAASFADVNRDGKMDIVAGEYWYAGPMWTAHKFREIRFESNYVDDFADLTADFDGDGWVDVVSVGWFGKNVTFWKNPGRVGGMWKKTDIETRFNVEFAFLVDMDGDGKALEVLPQYGNKEAPTAWIEYKGGAWVKHEVGAGKGHGIGCGDLNGDKKTDIITPLGWYEAPADARAGGWTFHAEFTVESPGFMHVMDVNEDGRADVVTSLAHNYGIFWMENQGGGKWAKRMIDDSWSQAHAMVLADMNGDGRKDLVTGKRYMAHNGKDPGEREPLGVYWYENVKGEKGVEFVRHVIDYSTRAGGGMQISVADVNGDKRPDFVAGGKAGLHLFVNQGVKR